MRLSRAPHRHVFQVEKAAPIAARQDCLTSTIVLLDPKLTRIMSPAYKVTQVDRAGVGLVASRDLVVGELILSDSPTILSPPTR